MARAPIITSPCPLRWSSLPQAGRDHCGRCDRRVHNLDGMGDAQRKAFLAGCEGKVCVAYTVHASRQRRNVALGAGLVAAMVGSTAMAAGPLVVSDNSPAGETSPVVATGAPESEELEMILVGGIEDAANVRWADEDEIAADAPAEPQVIAGTDWLPSAAE